MDYGFKVAARAREDIRAIWRYIARDNSSAATHFCDELFSKAESLKSLPDRHGSFVKRPNIRKLPFQAYLIFYQIDEKTRTVEILRFRHAARDQRRLRLKEEPVAYETGERARLDEINLRRQQAATGQALILPGEEVLQRARALLPGEWIETAPKEQA